MFKRIRTFRFNGKTPSKKNTYGIRVVSAKGKKPFAKIYPSKEYKEFVDDIGSQFVGQPDWPEEPIGRCHIDFSFNFKTKKRTDIDNKATAVLDALQELDILVDDSWQYLPEISVKGQHNVFDGFTITIKELEDA